MPPLDQLSCEPASTVMKATGNQMVNLCKAVCEEQKSRVLDRFMESCCYYFLFPGSVPYNIVIVIVVFTEFDEV